jgi:drug/metabolite transporter (DMT)-like permease
MKSFQTLTLSMGTSLSYTNVLFVTILSGPILKEYSSRMNLMLTIVGFVGVIVIVNPIANNLNIGVIYSILFAISNALIMILSRKLTISMVSKNIVLYCLAFETFFASTTALFDWQYISFEAILYCSLSGIIGAFGQFFMTIAYSKASARVVAPIIYTSALWSTLLGYFIWNEVPDINVYIGAFLIIISGIGIAYKNNNNH